MPKKNTSNTTENNNKEIKSGCDTPGKCRGCILARGCTGNRELASREYGINTTKYDKYAE